MDQDVQVQGDLGEMPVSYLLQWMGWSRKSGLLELHGASDRYELRFVEGRLTECCRLLEGAARVELDRGRAPEDLLRLLREPLLWTEGRFALHEAGPQAPAGNNGEPAPVSQPERAPEASALAFRRLVADGLLEGRYELPLLSEAAVKIGRMSRDPRASLKQLAEVVATDAALSQAVLRYANSSPDGPTRPIDSLTMAVARVGFRTIRPLALGVCLYSREMRNARLGHLQRDLWRHSLSVALLSRHLAVKLRLEEGEAFLCGLLHDLGKAVLVGLIDELILREHAPLALGMEGLEQLLFEHHCQVAATLLAAWSLPDSVQQVVALHHSPEKASDGGRKLVAVVALANRLINWLERDRALPESAELVETAEARMLGLNLRQVESLEAAAMEFFEQGQNFIPD